MDEETTTIYDQLTNCRTSKSFCFPYLFVILFLDTQHDSKTHEELLYKENHADTNQYGLDDNDQFEQSMEKFSKNVKKLHSKYCGNNVLMHTEKGCFVCSFVSMFDKVIITKGVLYL